MLKMGLNMFVQSLCNRFRSGERRIFDHVVPEMPLGTIVPILASITAIGSIKLVKSRKLRRGSARR